ncbi:MAG: pSer/pThr/pTyr-binding forkhead associated (FHA) protein [Planctomycetota bacterium]|jgi:pSer/pThr/pTyr-binding forkhead associated (FHA) protein
MEVRIECIEGMARGKIFPLKNRKTLIGRSSSCDVCLDANEELGVSGRHCEIRVIGDQVTIEDCGSTNGTLLAGKRLTEPTVLKDGATFRLGRQGPIFRFQQLVKNPLTSKEKRPGQVSAADALPSSKKWIWLFAISLLISLVCGFLVANEYFNWFPY